MRVAVLAGLFLGVAARLWAADSTWPHDEYSLDAADTLTAADRLGPDGRIYPDWSRAGMEQGIPTVSGPLFPVPAPSGGSDSAAIQALIEAAGVAGGGVVSFGPGTWQLDQPLQILHDQVILRGAGSSKTTLRFTYTLNPGEVRLVGSGLASGTIFSEDAIEVHAFAGADELACITVTIDGQTAWTWTAANGNHLFSTFRNAVNFFGSGLLVDGQSHTITATAQWRDGSSASTSRQVIARNSWRGAERKRRFARLDSAIVIAGDQWTGRGGLRWNLYQNAQRGAEQIILRHAEGAQPALQAGDFLTVDGASTDAFDTLVGNTGIPNMSISALVEVAGIRPALAGELTSPPLAGEAASVVELARPLRHRFTNGALDAGGMAPIVNGNFFPISGVGIENLSLEQPANPGRAERSDELFANGIVMHQARNCWIRGVVVISSGRNPVGLGGIDLEVQDGVFDGAWWPDVGQGTAYVGWSGATDCLMDVVIGMDLRHAPNAQWGANGTVFRNCVFLGSDAQYHFNWAYDNLYENCVIDARRTATALQPGVMNGSYG